LELAIIPEIVPVPISSMATLLIFANPSIVYLFSSFILPIAKAPTMPPLGNAIKGSIFISAIGLKASIIIVTSGPNIDAKKLGSISEDTEISSLFTLSPLLINVLANINVTINPNIAGTIPAAITVVKGNSKASATDIVFGLGEIIFPALPPPIIANKIVGLDKPAFAPIANAIGATVITA